MSELAEALSPVPPSGLDEFFEQAGFKSRVIGVSGSSLQPSSAGSEISPHEAVREGKRGTGSGGEKHADGKNRHRQKGTRRTGELEKTPPPRKHPGHDSTDLCSPEQRPNRRHGSTPRRKRPSAPSGSATDSLAASVRKGTRIAARDHSKTRQPPGKFSLETDTDAPRKKRGSRSESGRNRRTGANHPPKNGSLQKKSDHKKRVASQNDKSNQSFEDTDGSVVPKVGHRRRSAEPAVTRRVKSFADEKMDERVQEAKRNSVGEAEVSRRKSPEEVRREGRQAGKPDTPKARRRESLTSRANAEETAGRHRRGNTPRQDGTLGRGVLVPASSPAPSVKDRLSTEFSVGLERLRYEVLKTQADEECADVRITMDSDGERKSLTIDLPPRLNDGGGLSSKRKVTRTRRSPSANLPGDFFTAEDEAREAKDPEKDAAAPFKSLEMCAQRRQLRAATHAPEVKVSPAVDISPIRAGRRAFTRHSNAPGSRKEDWQSELQLDESLNFVPCRKDVAGGNRAQSGPSNVNGRDPVGAYVTRQGTPPQSSFTQSFLAEDAFAGSKKAGYIDPKSQRNDSVASFIDGQPRHDPALYGLAFLHELPSKIRPAESGSFSTAASNNNNNNNNTNVQQAQLAKSRSARFRLGLDMKEWDAVTPAVERLPPSTLEPHLNLEQLPPRARDMVEVFLQSNPEVMIRKREKQIAALAARVTRSYTTIGSLVACIALLWIVGTYFGMSGNAVAVAVMDIGWLIYIATLLGYYMGSKSGFLLRVQFLMFPALGLGFTVVVAAVCCSGYPIGWREIMALVLTFLGVCVYALGAYCTYITGCDLRLMCELHHMNELIRHPKAIADLMTDKKEELGVVRVMDVVSLT